MFPSVCLPAIDLFDKGFGQHMLTLFLFFHIYVNKSWNICDRNLNCSHICIHLLYIWTPIIWAISFVFSRHTGCGHLSQTLKMCKNLSGLSDIWLIWLFLKKKKCLWQFVWVKQPSKLSGIRLKWPQPVFVILLPYLCWHLLEYLWCNFTLYTNVHLCAVNICTNNLGNTSSIHHLVGIFVFLLPHFYQ